MHFNTKFNSTLQAHYLVIINLSIYYLYSILPSKMVYWRELGLNYLRFSEIAARALRAAIKPEALSKYPGQGEASIKRYGADSGAKKDAQKEKE